MAVALVLFLSFVLWMILLKVIGAITVSWFVTLAPFWALLGLIMAYGALIRYGARRWPFLLALVLALGGGAAHAASVNLAWNATTNKSVAGFNIYSGPSSRFYTKKQDAGKTPAVTVSNLPAGSRIFFAVTAYTLTGVESDYSSEVSTIVLPPGGPVTNTVQITFSTDVYESADLLTWTVRTNVNAVVTLRLPAPAGGRFFRTAVNQGNLRVVILP